MASSHVIANTRKWRVTIEMDMLSDFDPYQLDFAKLVDAQGGECVSAYVEDLDIPVDKMF